MALLAQAASGAGAGARLAGALIAAVFGLGAAVLNVRRAAKQCPAQGEQREIARSFARTPVGVGLLAVVTASVVGWAGTFPLFGLGLAAVLVASAARTRIGELAACGLAVIVVVICGQPEGASDADLWTAAALLVGVPLGVSVNVRCL